LACSETLSFSNNLKQKYNIIKDVASPDKLYLKQ
jgi:hypothetical protein